MAITVQKRPNDRCWSGNPIYYQLYSAAAEADNTIYFQVAIWFKRRDAADFAEVLRLPYYPSTGTARIDLRDVIDSLLEYQLPGLGIGFVYENPLFSNKMSGHCYIKFREITVADPDPAWSTESANERFVIKGGISYQKWRGDNYWVNYFDIVNPFLTWEPNGRMASFNERMYLAWLNLTDIGAGMIKMRRKLVMTDGTEYFQFFDLEVSKYDVVYFPCGAAQLKLDEVEPTKDIWYWEIQVHDVTGGSPVLVSEAFKFELDNRYDANQVNLNYRNSLGGLSSVRVRGVIEYNLNRDFSEQERTILSDYFIEQFIQPRRMAANSTELMVYKGDIGHLAKEEQDRVRDIHFQRECWKEDTLKWLPVMVLTGNQRLKTTDDKLFTMPIEFAIASGNDPYYTPENINLAEGNEVTEPLCDAVIANPIETDDPGGWLISWDLISGDPVKYFISTPGVSGGAPHESAVTSYLFDWLPVGDNVITIKPLCLIGGVYYFGAAIQITVTVESACVGVGIDGVFAPPDAVADTPYSYDVLLTGTPPFTLAPSVRPAWMFLSIVGNLLSMTGTPDSGDIGIYDIAIEVVNCLFVNSLELNDTIDVTL